MIEAEEMREITVDKGSDEVMVVVPLKEYRKLVKKVAKLSVKKANLEDIIKDQEQTSSETYRRWWREECDKTKKLEASLEEAKALISQLKVDIDLLKGPTDEQ